MPPLFSRPTSSTDTPLRAAILAKAALTVVSPTPPLPATTRTELWEQKSVMSTRTHIQRGYIRPAVESARHGPFAAVRACNPAGYLHAGFAEEDYPSAWRQ